MPIDRYDRYGPPRLAITETGAYLIRDVLRDDGAFSGVCEYAVYCCDDVDWRICREGVEFAEISPFLPPSAL